MSAEPSRKRKSTSTSGKNQKKVKLVAEPDDGLKRLVETSNIFQSPAFNPKVCALVEETRAAVESNVQETEKAIPHMTPLEEGELEELSCNHYPSS